MPESIGIADTIATPAWKESDFKIVKGREIYEEVSLTGINRAVIDSLTAFITGEADMKETGSPAWPEIPPDKLVEYFLVDGSFALRLISEKEMKANEKLDDPFEFLTDLIEVHRRLVTQQLRDPDDKLTDVTRVWQQQTSSWLVRDVKNYGLEGEQIEATNHYPLNAFMPYPNGQGLLYWNQFTYRRIEEIEQSIRQQTGKAALSLILTGYMGDIKQAQQAFATGSEIVHIPGNPTVTRVASTSTADQLMRSGDKLMLLFLKNTHQVEISETATLSGVARRLAMTPMLHFIRMIQRQITAIYATLGYELSLRGLNIMTPEERSAELDFLKRGRDEGHLDEQEYRTAAKALYN